MLRAILISIALFSVALTSTSVVAAHENDEPGEVIVRIDLDSTQEYKDKLKSGMLKSRAFINHSAIKALVGKDEVADEEVKTKLVELFSTNVQFIANNKPCEIADMEEPIISRPDNTPKEITVVELRFTWKCESTPTKIRLSAAPLYNLENYESNTFNIFMDKKLAYVSYSLEEIPGQEIDITSTIRELLGSDMPISTPPSEKTSPGNAPQYIWFAAASALGASTIVIANHLIQRRSKKS